MRAAGPRNRTGAAAARPPVPEGFGVVLDGGTRRIDGGSTVVGGNPLTVLRLSPAGAGVVDALVAGSTAPSEGAPNRLARRLLDLGLAHPRPPAGGPSPEVTVVIPVRDDPAGLTVTLAHVGPVGRVLVVDDGSAEAVRHVIATDTHRPRTEVIRLERSRGPAAARQVGWEAATTEVVAFVDAGCEPGPGWLDPLVAHLADPAVAAVAPRIRARPAPGAPVWLGAYEAVRSPLDLGPGAAPVRPRSRVPYVPTAALVVRRSALQEVGGFDATLRFGEDVDLVWRLDAAGWVVCYEPSVIVGHLSRPSLPRLLRQRFDYGSSAAPLAGRHGDAVAPLALSAWSAAAWGAAALGRPVLGAGVAAASIAALAARLRNVDHPWEEAVRLAGGGHLRSGRLIAEACRRSWWPLVAVACLCSRRARRIAVVTALVPLLLETRPPSAALRLPGWVALRLADDLAYGVGVWAGAARARSWRAVRPQLTSWPTRHRSRRR